MELRTNVTPSVTLPVAGRQMLLDDGAHVRERAQRHNGWNF
jgi:hypothetical protein